MAGEGTLLFVNEELSSVPITSLFHKRDSLWLHLSDLPIENGHTVHGSDYEEPLPISQNGTLQSGVHYPSSIDPVVRCYLLRYRLYIATGRYIESPKYRGTNDDPIGYPAWVVTLDLDAVAPQASGFALRGIDHQAVVRISSQMLVYDRNEKPIAVPAPTRMQDGTAIDDFVRNRGNTDASTNGMMHLRIAEVDAAPLFYYGYDKCELTDCDWGVINVPFTASKSSGTYQFSFKPTPFSSPATSLRRLFLITYAPAPVSSLQSLGLLTFYRHEIDDFLFLHLILVMCVNL
ncbi:hypothetical protein [Dictyobacter formicarum]|uniref:Uncharacterized protein n=1 Tax=Dictyobacter formicarum TaxID=2778368 RepID=A0ABQ3VAA1_9CHLR|nr:hypothetical protein [Dictyobacter formicarum]GHO82598.1 hypothetical protein KSZ_06040 [Dictyobacter formicarum]